MPLRVNNNIIALNTRRQLRINNGELATRIERLSSGLRINRAADDAAGLSVTEGMRAQISGFKQSVTNAEHGSNLIQTAEGALNESPASHELAGRLLPLAPVWGEDSAASEFWQKRRELHTEILKASDIIMSPVNC